MSDSHVDFAFPTFRQVEFVLQPPSGFFDVFESRFEFPLGVIAFVQDRIVVHSFSEFVVFLEGFGDLPILEDSDGKAVDVANGPMTVGLEDDIRIIALGERFERFCDEGGVALIEQASLDDGCRSQPIGRRLRVLRHETRRSICNRHTNRILTHLLA